MAVYKTLKDLPGVPKDSEVMIIQRSSELVDVLSLPFGATVAYIPQSELHQWITTEPDVKRIEPMEVPANILHEPDWIRALIHKQNEIIAAINPLLEK